MYSTSTNIQYQCSITIFLIQNSVCMCLYNSSCTMKNNSRLSVFRKQRLCILKYLFGTQFATLSQRTWVTWAVLLDWQNAISPFPPQILLYIYGGFSLSVSSIFYGTSLTYIDAQLVFVQTAILLSFLYTLYKFTKFDKNLQKHLIFKIIKYSAVGFLFKILFLSCESVASDL